MKHNETQPGETMKETDDTSSETTSESTGADVCGLTRLRTDADQSNAKYLPNTPRETFAEKPSFEAPRTAKRLLQSWAQCRRCTRWYAAPNKKLNQGFAIYCSIRCNAAHAAATGRYKGANNPRWLGGVSTDNMRYRRRQMEREPVQEAARRAVQYALRSGRLIRLPCENCGDVKSQGHHDDYSKPLRVRWLCRKHHDEHHVAERKKSP